MAGGSRERILAAARRLFTERGYSGLSMREIAAGADASKALIYYYFEDKEDLFLGVLLSFLEDMRVVLDEAAGAGGTCRQRIAFLLRQIVRQSREHRAVIRLASQELIHLSEEAQRRLESKYRRMFLERIERLLGEGIAAGELRQMDPSTATWVLLGMIFPYLYPSPVSQLALDERTVEQILTIFFEGAQAPSQGPN